MICTVTNHPYKIIHDQITNVILDGTNKFYTYNLPYKITQEQLIAKSKQLEKQYPKEQDIQLLTTQTAQDESTQPVLPILECTKSKLQNQLGIHSRWACH